MRLHVLGSRQARPDTAGETLSLLVLLNHDRICATPDALILSTADPPAIHSVDYRLFSLDIAALEDEELAELEYTVYVSELPWIVDPDSQSCPVIRLYSDR